MRRFGPRLVSMPWTVTGDHRTIESPALESAFSAKRRRIMRRRADPFDLLFHQPDGRSRVSAIRALPREEEIVQSQCRQCRTSSYLRRRQRIQVAYLARLPESKRNRRYSFHKRAVHPSSVRFRTSGKTVPAFSLLSFVKSGSRPICGPNTIPE
jgi:hypothetical protein